MNLDAESYADGDGFGNRFGDGYSDGCSDNIRWACYANSHGNGIGDGDVLSANPSDLYQEFEKKRGPGELKRYQIQRQVDKQP